MTRVRSFDWFTWFMLVEVSHGQEGKDKQAKPISNLLQLLNNTFP